MGKGEGDLKIMGFGEGGKVIKERSEEEGEVKEGRERDLRERRRRGDGRKVIRERSEGESLSKERKEVGGDRWRG